MKNKWKKTSAALLIAGLTIGGTGYALAEGGKVTQAIDLSPLTEDEVEKSPVSPVTAVEKTDDAETNNGTAPNTDVTTETDKSGVNTETDKEDGTTGSEKEEVTETELPEIPEGYTAGNLAALAKAYEQAGNPNAKAAIKRNMERSIAKWESKQPVVEAPKEEGKETAPVTEEKPKVEEPAKEVKVAEKAPVQEEKPAKVKAENPQAELNAKHKEQRETLKAAQKAEREALKEARKAAKELEKQEKKEKKN